MLNLVWLIPLLPLAGFLINGILGRRFLRGRERIVSVVACGTVFLSLVLTAGAVYEYASSYAPAHEHGPYINRVTSFTWIPGGSAVLSEGHDAGVYSQKGLSIEWSYQIDQLSCVMMLVVTLVGFLIHVFATGYMREDPGYYRFFAYMNLFMFMMLVLVMSSNFMMMFVGWEGVGLCSYLLIGYYFNRQEAADASKKAFVVNRIGDFGFLLAILAIFSACGTLQFTEVFNHIWKNYPVEAFGAFGLMSWIALGLFTGATGKSAQIPLYIWLPDAMAGPTPVSALIHAATMVTAGVFMVTRCNAIFQKSPTVMMIVAVVGVLTAVVAATIAFTQTDIKKVLAYSTVSQLGYMFLGCGVGAFFVGIFHVMTHAFFKALMFLGSGSIIHSLHHEQDMERMGGLKKYMPVTYWTFVAGWLAICGIFPFAGFFSKDEILWRTFSTSVFGGGKTLWVLGFITAGFTAFYMTRLMALTFWGEYRFNKTAFAHSDHGGEHGHAHHGDFFPHESPRVMTWPLILLAVGALASGWVGWPQALGGSNAFEHWLEPVIYHEESTPTVDFRVEARIRSGVEDEHSATVPAKSAVQVEEVEHEVEPIEYLLMAGSVLWAIAFMWFAYYTYIKRPGLPDKFATSLRPLYVGSKNLWYWNDLWDNRFIEAAKRFNTFLWRTDQVAIDGGVNGSAWFTRFSSKMSGYFDKYVVDLLVNAVAWIVRIWSAIFRTLQTGLLENYAFAIVLGFFIAAFSVEYQTVITAVKTAVKSFLGRAG